MLRPKRNLPCAQYARNASWLQAAGSGEVATEGDGHMPPVIIEIQAVATRAIVHALPDQLSVGYSAGASGSEVSVAYSVAKRGGWRTRAACSKAKARRMSRGSLNALPRKLMATGRPAL
jgi:hypothetical protein